MKLLKFVKKFTTLTGPIVVLALAYQVPAAERLTGARLSSLPTTPGQPFLPSNARTQDGQPIPTHEFFKANRCASCHSDTHSAWAESLHRNAGREPFYKESVEILEKARAIEFARHCESCHAPVSLLSGALTQGSVEPRSLDDEGVTCSVCHSITEARLDGTGSYTISRPALLAKDDGTPVFGDVPDSAILQDIPGHRRAMMRPLLRQPEFCGVCHKSSAPPELNGYKFTRGFSTYDEWQQSSFSKESVTPFYRRDQRQDCRSCHMPKVTSANDKASKDGKISSHRWLGANTAVPLLYGHQEQLRLTTDFLKANVLALDLFAIRRETTGEIIAPISPSTLEDVWLKPGEEITAEVVVSNRNAAHSFPPELRDLYEAWVEFEVTDTKGKTLFRSGYLNSDGTLDESAHTYHSLLLDEQSNPLRRHEVWLSTIKAYDNALLPGRSDLVRFRFRLPDLASQFANPIALRVKVNYRRFFQEYSQFVLNRQKSHISIPVVTMAESVVPICVYPSVQPGDSNAKPSGTSSDSFVTAMPGNSPARRWNDYAIALLEQAQYGPAAEAFRRAAECDPGDPSLLVNVAIAEMKTERYAPEREQLNKALPFLEAALKMDPLNGRSRFYFALILRAQGKLSEAAELLHGLAQEHQRDREVLRQLGLTLYSLGRISDARKALEEVIKIDPTDAGAYEFLTPILQAEGKTSMAATAQNLYLLWRDDPRSDFVALRFFQSHPEWADERIGAHVHHIGSPHRPIRPIYLDMPEPTNAAKSSDGVVARPGE